MNHVWVVNYDDHCPDPARFIAGVFTTEEKAKAFLAAKVRQDLGGYPYEAQYRRNPEHDYEIVQVELDPEGGTPA